MRVRTPAVSDTTRLRKREAGSRPDLHLSLSTEKTTSRSPKHRLVSPPGRLPVDIPRPIDMATPVPNVRHEQRRCRGVMGAPISFRFTATEN